MFEKLAKTEVAINELIARRWSCRSFNPDKEVSMDAVLSICEAARWAPSCNGDEPWRFLIFNKHRDPESYQKAFNCLDEWNQKWVKNVPVLFIAIADSKFRKRGNFNRWGQFDTGAACENIYLQALSLDIRAHPMGGFDKDKVIEVFGIPEGYTPMAFIAIGYQDEPGKLEEGYLKSEIADRVRKPIGSNFFEAFWENPIA